MRWTQLICGLYKNEFKRLLISLKAKSEWIDTEAEGVFVLFTARTRRAGNCPSVSSLLIKQLWQTLPVKNISSAHTKFEMCLKLCCSRSLSLSLFLCMLSMSLAPVNGQPLSAKHTEKKEKFLAAKTLHCFCFCCCLCVCRSAKRRQHNPSLTRPERERERLAVYTFRNRNLRYENSNVRRVFCVVSLQYSVASQDGCLHELRCKSVSVPAATSPTWAEKKYSSKSKHGVEILLWQNYLSKSRVTGNKRYIHIFLIVGISGVFFFLLIANDINYFLQTCYFHK